MELGWWPDQISSRQGPILTVGTASYWLPCALACLGNWPGFEIGGRASLGVRASFGNVPPSSMSALCARARVWVCVCVILLTCDKPCTFCRHVRECIFSFFFMIDSWPTKTPLPSPVKTYLPVSALGPSAGSWGIQSSSSSFPSHFVLCHSWCLAQRGRDPYPHGSSHLVLGMPFRRSGIHGTFNFISFVVIIIITTLIIFTISSSCSTRQGRICTGTVANKAVLPWSSLMRAHGFRRNMPARRRSCVSRSGNQLG